MKTCIVFGNTYYSEMLSEYLEEYAEIEVVAYTVHREYIEGSICAGKRVVAFENIEQEFPPENHSMLVALGHKQMNTLREEVFSEVRKKGYVLQSFIHPDAKVYTQQIGQGNIFLESVNISKHVQIGDGNIFWNGCNISHHSVIGNYNFFAPSVATGGKTVIKNNCFIGINATIKGGITVEDYTLIGAGAYLAKSSEKYDVFVHGKRNRLENKISLEMKI